MNRIVDKRGHEIKAGDYVLVATSCTGKGYMRVAKIKEIGPKKHKYANQRNYVKLRTICSGRWSFNNQEINRGWTDIPIFNTKWNPDIRSNELIKGDIHVMRVIKIDDPTQFLNEYEIEGAKRLGLL
jgi:hypothetical protein